MRRRTYRASIVCLMFALCRLCTVEVAVVPTCTLNTRPQGKKTDPNNGANCYFACTSLPLHLCCTARVAGHASLASAASLVLCAQLRGSAARLRRSTRSPSARGYFSSPCGTSSRTATAANCASATWTTAASSYCSGNGAMGGVTRSVARRASNTSKQNASLRKRQNTQKTHRLEAE